VIVEGMEERRKGKERKMSSYWIKVEREKENQLVKKKTLMQAWKMIRRRVYLNFVKRRGKWRMRRGT
jgi:hypothetical protein